MWRKSNLITMIQTTLDPDQQVLQTSCGSCKWENQQWVDSCQKNYPFRRVPMQFVTQEISRYVTYQHKQQIYILQHKFTLDQGHCTVKCLHIRNFQFTKEPTTSQNTILTNCSSGSNNRYSSCHPELCDCRMGVRDGTKSSDGGGCCDNSSLWLLAPIIALHSALRLSTITK